MVLASLLSEDLIFMTNELILAGFYLLTLVYSVIIHEVSHGVVALWLGDLTAKYAGRLTLSPWSHIDPFGSVILPALLVFTTGFAFGYAKPVPYNPYNLRDQKWGSLKVALAGPASNFLMASIATFLAFLMPLSLFDKQEVLMRFSGVIGGSGAFLDRFSALAESIAGSFPSIFFWTLASGDFLECGARVFQSHSHSSSRWIKDSVLNFSSIRTNTSHVGAVWIFPSPLYCASCTWSN